MKEDILIPIVFTAIVILVFFAGYASGVAHQNSVSVARWTVDPTTGKTSFEYLKPEEKKP